MGNLAFKSFPTARSLQHHYAKTLREASAQALLFAPPRLAPLRRIAVLNAGAGARLKYAAPRSRDTLRGVLVWLRHSQHFGASVASSEGFPSGHIDRGASRAT